VAKRAAYEDEGQSRLHQSANSPLSEAARTACSGTTGTFKQIGEGEYLGNIFTLSLRANGVRIVSVTRTSDNAPSHRILIGRIEVGAGWSKHSEETERDYLSVKLDDPSFNAPIYANLIKDEGGEAFSLIWSRPNRRQGD
jgi:uncharacterized protein (DUF736 family)